MASRNYTSYRRYDGNNILTDNGSEIQNWDTSQSKTYQSGYSGTDKPNYRSLIKARADATNGYGGTYLSLTGGVGTGRQSWRVRVFPPPNHNYLEIQDGFMGLIGAVVSEANVDPSVQNSAKGAFCKQAVSKISPFSGGPFIGELREAIHMIRNPAKALFETVLNYAEVSKNWRRKIGQKSWKRIASESWLESVFGWAPLISDVKSGAEAVSRVVNGFIPNTHCFGAAEDTKQIQPATKQQRNIDEVTWYYYQMVSDTTSCKVNGAVRIEPANTLSGALDVFGIGWDQVLPTAWELLPFSFVTDYFSNVGDIIASASLLDGRIVYCSMTTKTVRLTRQSGFTAVPSTKELSKASVSAGELRAEITRYTRQHVGNPVPSLQFKCPGIKSMKWLNLAALVGANS